MTTRLTLFTATLVQDSALSVSGLDREITADQPFTIVDGKPILVGRGLKGAAVAMARRFFKPLPRAVSDDPKNGALRRSAWEFEDAVIHGVPPHLRAGVGIHHKTGARAGGVLYDREVIPARTTWQLSFRVDRSYALDDAEFTEAEGILGYVLAKHWKEGRCWLGGGVARGLGWCHLENLLAYRLDDASYNRWVESGRADTQLPNPLKEVPTVAPTRSWYFRTLDVNLSFGEYQPDPDEAAWGLDMLAVGPHDAERVVQPTGDGMWAKPSWVSKDDLPPKTLSTDRAILMEGDRPLLPGASVRGPLRHAFSRAERMVGHTVQDPHLVQGSVGLEDVAGNVFGTVAKSSRVLIQDGRANDDWAAAKLHMHAEDEFSAGSYGSSKRDAVRVLKGTFPIRIVIEGGELSEVESLVKIIDRPIALGALGHLPVGGHKTRGAGWGRWQRKTPDWCIDDVHRTRSWKQPEEEPASQHPRPDFLEQPASTETWVRTDFGTWEKLRLGEAAQLAQRAFGNRTLIAWWCDPTIDLERKEPPATFGREWPPDEDNLQVDEVAFYSACAVWRAARTAHGARSVFIEEVASGDGDAKQATVTHTPARLHGFPRFSSADTGKGNVLLREWHVGNEILGFTLATLVKEER